MGGAERPFEPGFELIEHTADLALAASGRDLPELFTLMARALFSVIADVDLVRPLVSREVALRTGDRPALLRAWLAELNYLHEINGEIYSRFEVRIEADSLTARIAGEAIDPSRHDLRHEVKAITWHDLLLEPIPGGWRAYVLLDV